MISEKSDPKQETSNKKEAKMVPSTTKPKDLYAKPKISLEDKVYL